MKRLSPLALGVMALFVTASGAAAGTDVNVSISGYIPAPAGVHVYVDGGRPYYRESGRVIYLEKEKPRHKGKRGHGYGHREHEGGHGHGKHH